MFHDDDKQRQAKDTLRKNPEQRRHEESSLIMDVDKPLFENRKDD
jgi:hypothetical protein